MQGAAAVRGAKRELSGSFQCVPGSFFLADGFVSVPTLEGADQGADFKTKGRKGVRRRGMPNKIARPEGRFFLAMLFPYDRGI